jgi:hypothetical protein
MDRNRVLLVLQVGAAVTHCSAVAQILLSRQDCRAGRLQPRIYP